MPHALVHKVVLDGQFVQLSGSNEFAPDELATDVDIYFVIMQGDVAVRGRWTIPAGEKSWTVSALMDVPYLQPGAVVTTGLAVFETSEPMGFETYTWTQSLLATRANRSAENAA
ncbi:MAG TPA: hypothetical protein VH912_07780 [Streptosporangiaceae bacterium]|jgi:hypothetical protein